MQNSNNKLKEPKKDSNKGGHMMKHGLMMMLCCLIPIVLIAGLPLFGLKAGALTGLIFLLCPLMHIGMMVFMLKGRKNNSSCHGQDENKKVSVEIED